MSNISKYFFGYNAEGNAVNHYVIENIKGSKVVISQLGAAIVSIIVPDKKGEMKDVVLGYNDVNGYETGEEYFGATVGRCCGRIQDAKFILNGKEYLLPKNNGKNHLHGGIKSFSRKVWDCEQQNDKLIFSLKSTDGEEGYPGNMFVSVVYSFDDSNRLYIEYNAVSDKDTICNLTNHTFFNLNGHETANILRHLLKINAKKYIPLNDNLIPKGEIESVINTPFDFIDSKPILDGIKQKHQQLTIGKGFDHSFVLDKEKDKLVFAATAVGEKTGIRLDCYTTNHILHLYTGNYVNRPLGKNNVSYGENSGFCFETQGYPDAINQPNFISTKLKAGETYKQITTFKFSNN
ncbi:MAG: galactose mutarotase [Clostridia bacterium]|nr:galactose mutarotase [Clostridia bacterium]